MILETKEKFVKPVKPTFHKRVIHKIRVLQIYVSAESCSLRMWFITHPDDKS